MRSKGLIGALAVLASVGAGACSRQTEHAEGNAARTITFNRDIAPILFENCASCHRPIDDAPPKPLAKAGLVPPKPLAKAGLVPPKPLAETDPNDVICVAGAPFSVLDYASVRRNARAIASAVQRRAMPPWLPESGHGVFTGERRLRDDQIALISRWVDGGAPEGDPADAPKTAVPDACFGSLDAASRALLQLPA